MTNFKRTADWLQACGKEPSPENMAVQIGKPEGWKAPELRGFV